MQVEPVIRLWRLYATETATFTRLRSRPPTGSRQTSPHQATTGDYWRPSGRGSPSEADSAAGVTLSCGHANSDAASIFYPLEKACKSLTSQSPLAFPTIVAGKPTDVFAYQFCPFCPPVRNKQLNLLRTQTCVRAFAELSPHRSSTKSTS